MRAVLLAVVLATLAGCAAPRPCSTTITELSPAYEQAIAPHRRDVRKPIREERARALQRLASRVDALRAQLAVAESKAATTPAAERGPAEAALVKYDEALTSLAAAARQGETWAVRRAYRAAGAARAQLDSSVPPVAAAE